MKYQSITFTEHTGHMVTLRQTPDAAFEVQYGASTKSHLTYSEACAELGECLMHGATAEGLFDVVGDKGNPIRTCNILRPRQVK